MKNYLSFFTSETEKKVKKFFKEYSFANIKKEYDGVAFAVYGNRIRTEHIMQLHIICKNFVCKNVVVFLILDFGVERLGTKKELLDHIDSTTKTSNKFLLEQIYMEDDDDKTLC